MELELKEKGITRKNLSKMLIAIKEDRGLTWKDLAKEFSEKSQVNISDSWLKHIALGYGSFKPSKKRKLALARALDMPYLFLWGDDND